MRLDPDGHARVAAAVAAAEAGTAGEIVTIVARRSDRYSDIALRYTLLALLFVPALSVAWPAFPDFVVTLFVDGWTGASVRELLLGLFAVQVLVGLGVWLLTRALGGRVVPKATRRRRVRAHALQLFRVAAEARTTGRTGILIYLSLAERMAEIVGDEAIHTRVAPEHWGDAMLALVGEVREGRLAEGMVAAVEQVGALLAEHLPRLADDVNELPDRLIEL